MKPHLQLCQQTTVSANNHHSHPYGDKTCFLIAWLGNDNTPLFLRRLLKKVVLHAKPVAPELRVVCFWHIEHLPTLSGKLAKPFVNAWVSFVMVEESFKKYQMQ